MNRKKFTLDGSNFNTLESFYDEVERVLTKELDWKIGRNLDAFNDVLRGGFGAFEYEEPIDLIWKNSKKSKIDLGYDETVLQLNKALAKCHSTAISNFNIQLEEAKAKKGPTVFDWLVEIIKEHENVNYILE